MKINHVLWLVMAVVLSGCSIMGVQKQPVKTDYDKAYQDYLTLGAKYMEMGRYDYAESRLKRAIEINSQPPEAWNALAVLYETKRDIQSGYQIYQKLIQSHPHYALGFINFATFLCKFNRTSELQSLLEQMRGQGKDFTTLSYIAAGDCAVRHHQNSVAISAYQRAIENDPYASGALLPLAKLSLERGDVNGALRYLATLHTYVGYTPESVLLGIKAAKLSHNQQLENDLRRVMRVSYANSPEAKEVGL